MQKKIISLILAVLMALPFCSCSSKKKEYEVIKESDTWYDCTSFEIGDLYPSDMYCYADYEAIGATDDAIYIMVYAQKNHDGDISALSDEEYAQLYEQSVLKLSYEGEILEKTDFFGVSDDGTYQYLEKAYISDGTLNTLVLQTDYEGDVSRYLLNGEEVTVPSFAADMSGIFIEDVYTSSGYTVLQFRRRHTILRMLIVVRPDGSYYEVNPYDHFIEGVSEIGSEYIPTDDGRLIIPFIMMANDVVYTALDLETGQMTDLTGLYGISSEYLIEYAGDKILARDYNGIYTVNDNTGELTAVMGYGDADAPVCDVMDSRTLYVSDDFGRIVLGCMSYDGERTSFRIMDLSRAEVNPNAGKSVLIMSVAEDYFPDESDLYAAYLYNQRSSSTFIRFVFPYTDLGEYREVDADIILTDEGSASPSDKELYIDLMPYLDINDDNYFMNAFYAAQNGDALYKVPLNISASGIMTASVNIPEGQVGFTFDSYPAFVDSTCNGIDPMTESPGISMGKPEYFTRLFMNMSELFIHDGRVDLSGDEFTDLLMFVDEYGSETSPEEAAEVGIHNAAINAVLASVEAHNARISGTFGAVYGTLYSFEDYIDEYIYYGEGLGIYGIPSFDGRGPQTVSGEFVSISSVTSFPDECADFVRLLLSEEVQCTMYLNPVNRNALRTVAQERLLQHNEDVLSQQGRGIETWDTVLIPDEAVDDYIGLLSSSYESSGLGSSIEEILIEESSAYFYGSRAPEDVRTVMQDRIQTVLDENS